MRTEDIKSLVFQNLYLEGEVYIKNLLIYICIFLKIFSPADKHKLRGVKQWTIVI